MGRNFNTDQHGKNWSESTIRKVWAKASFIPGKTSNEMKADKCGHVISFAQYGNRNSNFGWEIDHINPVSNGGGDEIDNLQPLHWRNNVNKSDSLSWQCPR